MTEQPLVSVIINCYNSEKYLRETIDSVLSQTYHNFEVIFWDNCSTDSTAKIIKGYHDERFHYFLADYNTALGEARGLAIEKVKGDYFCFLDSDDVWLPDFLKRGVDILKEEEVVAFYSNYDCWVKSDRYPYNKTLNSGKHTLKTLLKNYGVGMSGCIVKSNVVNENNIRFDNRFQLIEDFDFFLKIAEYGPFFYVSDSLFLYRIHADNFSIQKKEKWKDEYHILYEAMAQKYINIPEPILKISDLSGIKNLEIKWTMSCLKDEGKRKELLYVMWHNKILSLRSPALLAYVFLGSGLYKVFRNVIK